MKKGWNPSTVRTVLLLLIGFVIGVLQMMAYCRFTTKSLAASATSADEREGKLPHWVTADMIAKYVVSEGGEVEKRVADELFKHGHQKVVTVHHDVEVPCHHDHDHEGHHHEHPDVVLDHDHHAENDKNHHNEEHHENVEPASKSKKKAATKKQQQEEAHKNEEEAHHDGFHQEHKFERESRDGNGDHVALAKIEAAKFNIYPGTLEEQDDVSNADKIVKYVKSRAWNGTIMLIPVNTGYVDFGINLMCSLMNLTNSPLFSTDARHKGFVFVAMDSGAHQMLHEMNLPVIKDPELPFVSSKSAAWGDPKFHQLVCTKLVVVVRMLKAGLRIILSDADIVYVKDPYAFLREDVSVTWSIGSCHKDIADNFHLSEGAIEKLNTGFYYAHPAQGLIKMMSKALDTCRNSQLTGDQPAINQAIMGDWSNGKLKAAVENAAKKKKKHDDEDDGPDAIEASGAYSYGFFDGCLFANGCIYFKHLCANSTYSKKQISAVKNPAPGKPKSGGLPDYSAETLKAYPRNEPVMVHANFLVGKKDKIKHLKRYNMWDQQCIMQMRSRLSDDKKHLGEQK